MRHHPLRSGTVLVTWPQNPTVQDARQDAGIADRRSATYTPATPRIPVEKAVSMSINPIVDIIHGMLHQCLGPPLESLIPPRKAPQLYPYRWSDTCTSIIVPKPFRKSSQNRSRLRRWLCSLAVTLRSQVLVFRDTGWSAQCLRNILAKLKSNPINPSNKV
jgi:hypothetical protein